MPLLPAATPPPNREGTSVGVRTRVRALGANADEHVRCSGVFHLPERGAHHEHNPGRGVPDVARQGCMGVGGRFRVADTPRVVQGASRVVAVYCFVRKAFSVSGFEAQLSLAPILHYKISLVTACFTRTPFPVFGLLQ